MSARFAIYLAPAPGSAPWRFGSTVLGYDAATGETLPGFAPAGYSARDWHAATAEPRLYGFHATLKAPFRLAEHASVDDLDAALAAFAASRKAFDLASLKVDAIVGGDGRDFAALVLSQPSEALAALELDVVREFDRFRAPLNEAERRNRRPERLTPRQREALETWGYPYVGPDFQFHMTLSGAIEAAPVLASLLDEALAGAVGPADLRVDALVLFVQPASGERFRIQRRYPFGG